MEDIKHREGSFRMENARREYEKEMCRIVFGTIYEWRTAGWLDLSLGFLA